LRLFEAIWVISISYPDPRIWNNRVAALAGTARSNPALAVSAAMAVTEAGLYGHRPSFGAIHFLLETQRKLDEGSNLGDLVKLELKQRRKIFGYGRPNSVHGQYDERIEPLLKRARHLDLADGTYLKLVFAIDSILANGRWRMRINIGGLAAALCADQGLTPREFLAFLVPGYIGGMTPCYLDALNHPEGSLFPLRCSRIDYLGQPPRSWD
jgi:citrate synthase